MTAPADSTARLIEVDAKRLADRATDLAFTAAAGLSIIGFGAVCAVVLFLAVTL